MLNRLWLIIVLALAACSTPGGSITVVNSSGQAICYLFVAPESEPIWYEDALGANIITNTEHFVVRGVESGYYSIRAVFCDNSEFFLGDFFVDGDETLTIPASR